MILYLVCIIILCEALMTNSLAFDNIPMKKIFNSYSMSSLM